MVKKICITFLLIFFIACFFAVDVKILLGRAQNLGTVLGAVSHLKVGNICHKKLFLILANKFHTHSKKIKNVVYSFSEKNIVLKALKSLTNGSEKVLRVTIPEGNNVTQTAEIISKVVRIDKEKFIRIAKIRGMEGYLMPETYFLAPGITEEEIIDMMYCEFNKKILPSMYERVKKLNLDFKDVIIVASIVEKEAVEPSERSIIAAVFLNRLNKKIKLQSCATVLYAMKVNKPRLSATDTKFNSPYNTYIHGGLPPGPICSPGLESIKSVLYPEDTKNLFFVSIGNGKHLFAKNFCEHKKNKQIVKKTIKFS
jgi:UPF0755 protein